MTMIINNQNLNKEMIIAIKQQMKQQSSQILIYKNKKKQRNFNDRKRKFYY